jgi:hypothetical protein
MTRTIDPDPGGKVKRRTHTRLLSRGCCSESPGFRVAFRAVTPVTVTPPPGNVREGGAWLAWKVAA